MTLSPANTWAVVVGIEEYPALPDDWRLPGPAKDAIRFANWLLERGVPPAQIRLCLSASDADVLLAELTAPLLMRGANREDILSLLDEVAQWNGELLYVFWGGHGSVDSVDKSEPRRLYFANAAPNSPIGLSLDGLTTMLRRRRSGEIPHQAILIDACATFQARARFKMEAEPSSPPYGLVQNPAVRQFQFFASRRGEAAIDLRAERTGAFSQELLKALGEAPIGTWPPNLVDVARRVQASFEALRASGRGAQTPIFIGNDWDGGALLTGTLFSERLRQLSRLRAIIDRLPLTTATVLSLFRATFTESPKLVEVETLDDVIDFLLARPATVQSPRGEWPPEAELAERIREHCVACKLTELAELLDWIADVPPRQLTDLRAALGEDDRRTRRYLLIELAPGAESPRVESAWLYRQGQPRYYRCWTPAEFGTVDSALDRIRRVLRDTAASGVTSVTVEFVAPRTHLAHSPYAWTLDDEFEEPLGSQYPVVVRWRDRLAEPAELRQGVWRDAAVKLFRALVTRKATTIHWLPANIADAQEFFQTLESGTLGDLLMAGYVTADFGKRHPVMFALAGGAPAVSWWTAAVDEAVAKPELEKLLAEQPPEELAIALQRGRGSKDPRCRAVCSATVLFWDHPDRNPYAEKL